MRIRSSVAAAALTIVLSAVAVPALAAPGAVFRLTDPRLDEISGLAVGQRNPGLLYVQNDSGDSARFFALDQVTGVVRAVCDVPAATNHDWEDLATGPSAAGIPSVWLADIGDNDSERSQVELYRVDEPTVEGSTCSVGRPEIWRLRYPDGPHDAESLIVDSIRHRAYLVTKQLLGDSEVFAVPSATSTTAQTLTRIGTVRFRLTGTPGGPNPVGELTATGAAMSPDGRLLAIRTYTDAYLWPVVDGDVADALEHDPTVLPLPSQPQGEGIAVDGSSLLIDSEKVGSTVYRVALPAALVTHQPAPAATRPSGTGSSATDSDRTDSGKTDSGRTGSSTAAAAGPSPSNSPNPQRGTVSSDGRAFIGAIALMAILAAAVAVGRWRRR